MDRNGVDQGQPAVPVRRVLTSSIVGTAIEWYDFFIYGTAAALVFPALFFPNSSPLAGTLASFATLSVGFFARPLGGIVFGHFGDRIGRKSMLVATLLIMGIATFAVGLVPSWIIQPIRAYERPTRQPAPNQNPKRMLRTERRAQHRALASGQSRYRLGLDVAGLPAQPRIASYDRSRHAKDPCDLPPQHQRWPASLLLRFFECGFVLEVAHADQFSCKPLSVE